MKKPHEITCLALRGRGAPTRAIINNLERITEW
jgi:hypothetical protein